MAYRLKSVELDPGQHPGQSELKMTAHINVGGKDVVLDVKAEHQSYPHPDRFTCRLDSWSSRNRDAKYKHGLRGLKEVEGLSTNIRRLAQDFWAKPVVPEPLTVEDIRFCTSLHGEDHEYGDQIDACIPFIKDSTTLFLKLEYLRILDARYTGSLYYYLADGKLKFGGRHDVNLVNPDQTSAWKYIGLSERVIKDLGEYLLTFAQEEWDKQAKLVRDKKIEELKKEISWLSGNIKSYEQQAFDARVKLKDALTALETIEKGPDPGR